MFLQRSGLGVSSAAAVWMIAIFAHAQATPGSAPGPSEQRVPAPAAAPSSDAPQSTTPQTPTVPQATTTTETTPPPNARAPEAAPARQAPQDEPPPAPPPPPGWIERSVAAVNETVRIYGILKPTITFASRAVESFGNPNASAITAAANPILANLPSESRLTFQVAQTRFGLWLGEKSRFRGHLEFDFIDFSKASPTVQALLRLRIAAVEWSVTEQLVLTAGQDWDLDAPVNAFGVNLVGTQFQSGNHGFMRQQVKALYTVAGALEIGAAVGLQTANATPKDVVTDEIARMPSFALRLTGLFGKVGRAGVSGIATRLRLPAAPAAMLTGERQPLAGAVTLFGDLNLSATTSLRFEGYLGRNVANLGSLALGSASRANDIDEAGFFVSVRQAFLEKNAVYATFGDAHVLNEGDVVPSYTYGSGTTAASAGSGTGYRWNQSARVGYEYKPIKALALALDGFWYNTRHQLLAADIGRVHARRHALGLETAAIFTF